MKADILGLKRAPTPMCERSIVICLDFELDNFLEATEDVDVESRLTSAAELQASQLKDLIVGDHLLQSGGELSCGDGAGYSYLGNRYTAGTGLRHAYGYSCCFISH